MNVFISWSGERSKAVASALREWLPDVFQAVKPWMSGVDILAGARWSREVEQRLADSRFCIICLTKENQREPWLLFEAGAVARAIDDVFVCPYLIDLSPSEVASGPLTLFQAKQANVADTRDLIMSLNAARPAPDRLSDGQVMRIFDKWWPELEGRLRQLPAAESTSGERDARDVMDEILDATRQIARQMTVITADMLSPYSAGAKSHMRSVHHLRLAGESQALEQVLGLLSSGVHGGTVEQQQRYSESLAGVNVSSAGAFDVTGVLDAATKLGVKVDVKFFNS